MRRARDRSQDVADRTRKGLPGAPEACAVSGERYAEHVVKVRVITGAELERLLAEAADPNSNVHLEGDTFVYWDITAPDDGPAGLIGVRGDRVEDET